MNCSNIPTSYDAASFINSWMFPFQGLTGGGPHAIYGYSFNNPSPPAIFDGNPDTDFVLQASLEIPLVVTWPDPAIDGAALRERLNRDGARLD